MAFLEVSFLPMAILWQDILSITSTFLKVYNLYYVALDTPW